MLGIWLKGLVVARLAAMPWRRCVGALLAAAFLVVTVSHVCQHYGTAGTAGVEASMPAHGDSPDPTDDATVANGHCLGCTVAALPVVLTLPRIDDQPAHTMPVAVRVSPHIVAHDPPPPRTSA